MYKIGLVSQAKFDFEMIVDLYPKELLIKYNYAQILFQLGEYWQAFVILESYIAVATKQLHSANLDLDLFYDVYMLKAQCLYRTNRPLESVISFNTAQRYKRPEKKAKKKRLTDF